MTPDLRYVAVGGADEIGMNFYAYGYGTDRKRNWIVADCGVAFGDSDTTPGVETVLPDPRFLYEDSENLLAVFITHAHEDHIGAVADLWSRLGRPPVHATPFAAAVASRKFLDAGHNPAQILQVETPGQAVTAGDFSVTFHEIEHSVPGSNLLEIRTPEGIIVHSGDFRTAPAPGSQLEDRLHKLGQEGVLCLACESTNIFEPGEGFGEADLRPRIEELLRASPRAVAATTFGSNVQRMVTLAGAAEDCGRKVFVAGRAMDRMLAVARETTDLVGFPTVPPGEAEKTPHAQRLYLVTGSQGEPRAALSRIAEGSHPEINLGKGDTVLYASSTIPGNQRAVHRVQNALVRRGIKVIDGELAGIHVSGHAGYDEVRHLYSLLKPRISIPIHGEARHLAEHAERAGEWGTEQVALAPNGTELRISAEKGVERVGQRACGRIYREGKLLLPAGRGVIRDRLRMAESGHVSVALVFDESRSLLEAPLVGLRGAPLEDPGWPDALDMMISEAVEKAVDRLSHAKRASEAAVEECVREMTLRVTRQRWGRRPAVTVLPTWLER